MPTEYIYKWKNNPKRAAMYGRNCKVINWMPKKNSCEIEFLDNGQREVVSRNAIKEANQ